MLVPEEQRRFGRYSLFSRLAKGGMANLYLAQYAGPDGFEKLVAIKRIHEHLSEDPDFITMFSDEARLAARISHPHVVQVLELGTVGSACFIAMEYVDGESLGALIKAARISLPICARIISQAALGLHAAHQLKDMEGSLLGVVHRDVSPQNVLVSYDGVVKVVDFGVAKAKSNLAHTESGTVKGKFGYMAPEQLKPEDFGALDRRTDVFPLGILLYEATTRRNLFKAQSDGQTIERVLHKTIKPPSKLIPDYPPALEQVVMRALERKKEDRFQTAHDMHVELEAYLAGCGEPVLPSNIADLMSFTFAERMQLKAEILKLARASTPNMDAVSSLHSLRDSSVRAQLRPKRRLGLVLAIVVAALLAVGLGYGVLFRPASAPPQAQPHPPRRAPAGPVHVVVRATPAGATIRFDGREVKNPFEIRHRREERQATVEVAAEGHVPQTFQVSLAEGGRWTVALERLPPAPRPVVETKPEPKKRPLRPWGRGKRPASKGEQGTKVIKDLLKNPYGS